MKIDVRKSKDSDTTLLVALPRCERVPYERPAGPGRTTVTYVGGNHGSIGMGSSSAYSVGSDRLCGDRLGGSGLVLGRRGGAESA